MAIALKAVLDTIQAGITTLLTTTGTTLADAISGVADQVTALQDDRIGTPSGATVSADILKLLDRLGSKKKVYPVLANDVAATGAAGVWTAGAWVQLINTNVVTTKYQVVRVHVASCTGIHQVDIGTGAGGSETVICSFACSGIGTFDLYAPEIAANTRLAARTASKAGGSQSLSLFVEIIDNLT